MFQGHGAERLLADHVADQADEDREPADGVVVVCGVAGVEIDVDGLMKIGERIFTLEKVFNLREGKRRKDDTLPERFFVLKTTDKGISGIDRVKFEEQLDEYYKFRGWDKEGFPTEEKLAELNLSDVAEQLRGLRVTG